MGPPSMMTSAAPSTVGSGSSSDWEKEYEDEDTWYEWSAAYQTGPEAQLLPAEDVKFNVRMARYRRASSKTSSRTRSRRERKDLRDLEREMEDNAAVERKPKKTSLWHLKNSADTQEGNYFSRCNTREFLQFLKDLKKETIGNRSVPKI